MERKSERAGEKAKAHIGRSKLQPFRIGLTRTLASLYIPIAAVFSIKPQLPKPATNERFGFRAKINPTFHLREYLRPLANSQKFINITAVSRRA